MDICLPIYPAGPTPIPAAIKNTCMFCGAAGYRSPGPCKSCGVTGYPGEQPPGLQLGRVWRRKGRTFEPEDPDCSLDNDMEAERLGDLALELSVYDLEEIDLEPDDDSGLHYDADVHN